MEVWHDNELGLPARQMRVRRRRLTIEAVIALAIVMALIIVLAFLPVTARAETLGGRLHVIDGDTVWHYAPCAERPEKIRLLDIDAPESYRSTCEAELIAGLRAKARLAELLQQKPVRIERCEASGRCEDRYGRTLARIHTPAGEVGAVLLREGLALKYEPSFAAKQGRTAHWCGR